jgi:hypothetical protein
MFDLPRRAETKVALHSLYQRADPSFEEGISTFFTFYPLIHILKALQRH